MIDYVPSATDLCSFLFTYFVHSTLVIAVVAIAAHWQWCLFWLRESQRRLLNRTKRNSESCSEYACVSDVNPEMRLALWKLALMLPIVTTFAVTVFHLPHFGLEFALGHAASGSQVSNDAAYSPEATTRSGRASEELGSIPEENEHSRWVLTRESEEIGAAAEAARPLVDQTSACLAVAIAWLVAVAIGLTRLGAQVFQVRQLRQRADVVADLAMVDSLNVLKQQMNIRRHIELLQSRETIGPLTAGICRPFVLIPSDLMPDRPQSGSLATGLEEETSAHTTVAERDAMLAHELIHIKRHDALWTLLAVLVRRTFVFQPLNCFAAARLRVDMDFVADMRAAQTLGLRTGLAKCLIRLSDRLLTSTPSAVAHYDLGAYMASFRSTLGRRIEILLCADSAPLPPTWCGRNAKLALMIGGSLLLATVVPCAVSQFPSNSVQIESSPNLRKKPMMKQLSTLAILAGFTLPVAADEPQQPPSATVQASELKNTVDQLPKGISQFNGMLVGRLVSKDIEKGTFVVQVDAVPRVWKGSQAEDPRSIVNKTVEVTGVFGKFLDVLVVMRKGETIEFECKHDGERLRFPGELLRKVAPFKPEDYPVLPEEFRGFQGTVMAEVLNKDPETFELIVTVNKVVDTWPDNQAKQPKSIEGKPLMLAGFWNRRDEYNGLKVGDQIEVGMQHIGLRSDHLTVANKLSKTASGKAASAAPMRAGESSAGASANMELRGFRGMLVGRLVEKDMERGTFKVVVDAVPRVWNNNESSNPKRFVGQQVEVEGVQGKLLDVLVVTRIDETVEFGARQDDDNRLRLMEGFRKVGPVKPGDYPELADDFRGFKGMVDAKIIKKEASGLSLIIEVQKIRSTSPESKAKNADSMIGRQAMLAGFWNRKEAFHSLEVGDTIECGVEHPQLLSDHLSVIESVKKISE